MIQIEHLTKTFGKRAALNDISFEVSQGDVFGLVGPNGAGKTTLLRILATLIRPTRGAVRVDGLDAVKRPNEVRKKFAYMPDTFGLYPDLTVREYLDFFSAVYHVPRKGWDEVQRDLLALVDLDAKADEPVERLSRGMQQRLGLARCLVHDPDLLLLDEPASGLDPHARRAIRALLHELQQMGKTIVISSHHLADVHELCNRLLILEEGKSVYCGAMSELVARHAAERRYLLRVNGQADKALEKLLERVDVASARRTDQGIEFELLPESEGISALLSALTGNGVDVQELIRLDASLEEVFMKLTSGAVS